ncbi:molecular chaperone [Lujinxingia vulgaris]|uniref:Molecular chaperone n=1 Tax=Lujinxingia vulgaris TaxID=2600176 RepID=A0A5C6X5Q4_9DELT|nr:fimbria/pilus periplasmic chaperone [Lujinxingia vulgaris]TXD34393.1 molecular chaperone [Lujinxingia vulgaris]
MTRSWRRWMASVVLVAGMSWSGAASAQSLSISPTRVVLEGRERSAELTLVNSSDQTLTYRVLFRRLAMSPTGQFQELSPEASGKFVDAFVRYSPRQVTLGPGETQTVRLMVRAPASLGDGEYRSHLTFQALPNATETPQASNSEALEVELKMRMSVSLPVIYRRGELGAELKAPELQITQHEGRPVAIVNLQRSGERSVYGDYELYYAPRQGLPAEFVGAVRGVAFYSPEQERVLRAPLSDDSVSAAGEWSLRFIARDGDQRAPAQPIAIERVRRLSER